MPKFVPYLTLNDYLTTIQSGQLNNQVLDVISTGGNLERVSAESWAIGIVGGILSDYFDLDFEITPTLPYSSNKKYYQNDRCVIDFPEWVSGTGQINDGDLFYAVGSCVIFEGFGYVCKVQNSDSEFNEQNWLKVGKQYDIYYIPETYTNFCLDIKPQKGDVSLGFYNVNDKVFYKGFVYECMIQTSLLSHQGIEQYFSTSDIPHANQFPTQKGQNQWKLIGEFFFKNEPPFYSIDGNSSLVETGDDNEFSGESDNGDLVVPVTNSIWTVGDNRDPVILQDIISLAIWILHKRISPNNIPKLRESSKDETFERLRMIQRGEFTISIPSIEPKQVGSISWGSDPKVYNRKR